jgi:hypothetical protein
MSTTTISGNAGYQNNSNGTQDSNTLTTAGGNQTGVTNTGQSSTGGVTTGGTGTTQQSNVYQPWQQQLAQTAGNSASDYSQTGNLPGNFGAPPQVAQAYIDNWKQNTAPQLAVEYGAGSPQLGRSLMQGLEGLTSQTYQNQTQNYNNTLGQATTLAQTPTGQTSSQAGNNTTSDWQNQALNSNQQTNWQQDQNQLIDAATAASNSGTSAYAINQSNPQNNA